MKRKAVVACLVIGIGLALAPAAFQMFTRAPKGGHMMTAFRPYMTDSMVNKFQGYMAEIGAADAEVTGKVPGLVATHGGPAPAQFAATYGSTAQFAQQWPTIKHDMSDDMLTKMGHLVRNFKAVNALPPFPLFPFFFVAPGLIIAALAGAALQRDRRGRTTRGLVIALIVMGVGVVAAPAIFQMFSRAPLGADMIDQFRPIMTAKKVNTVQGYFLVLGAGEGELRNRVEPAVPADIRAAQLPALTKFHADWPRISADMAPMIGAMSDNLGNYAAVKALPPFWLFPWFFVIPGLLVAGLALSTGMVGLPSRSIAARPVPAAERRLG